MQERRRGGGGGDGEGVGNILNFDQDARETVWHSSWFHSTSHLGVEQRWCVHTFKLKLTGTVVTNDALLELHTSCHNLCNGQLKPLQKIYSTFLQQLQLSKTFVVSQNEIPYLAWDMHALTLNMGVTYKPRDARFQYAIHFRTGSKLCKTS